LSTINPAGQGNANHGSLEDMMSEVKNAKQRLQNYSPILNMDDQQQLQALHSQHTKSQLQKQFNSNMSNMANMDGAKDYKD